MIKIIITNILKLLSYEIRKIHKVNSLTFKEDDRNFFRENYKKCEKESLNISEQRFLSLFQSVNYIYDNNIDGDLVECGVFRGGSAMMMAKSSLRFAKKINNLKKIWLYDTFEGMANPSIYDVNISNEKAVIELEKINKKKNKKDIWAYSPIDYVKERMRDIGYKDVKYIKGLVEQTLLNNTPDKISLLRLDTDFYESTKIELEILYPKLEVGGIIIIDDYGHWKGCKKAVDEYFINKKNIFFQQIDYSGLIGVKTK
tara:strand:- start:251 stop:1021 length:771 start_codon:yes stop_codon:yes gene_type:complete